jgi:eukaryotic-like serine/threonine-protein kinase
MSDIISVQKLRRHKRSPIRLRVLLSRQNDSHTQEVAILNISRTGAFMASTPGLRLNSLVTIRILDDIQTCGQAKVVRQGEFMGEKGYGIVWTDLDQAMLDIIARLLDDEFRFSNYVLEELVATGGMAEIYKARKQSGPDAGHVFALKRMRAEWVADTERLDLMKFEGEISQQLNHPSIVKVVEVKHGSLGIHLIEKFIDGPSLRQILVRCKERGSLLPFPVIALIIDEVARALDYLHHFKAPNGEPMQLIHRDVSPANILISHQAEVKLIDLGVVCLGNQTQHTQVIAGKPPYVAPEQLRGRPATPASDLFSLGATLYEIIAGEAAFYGDSKKAIWRCVRRCRPCPINSKRADTPPAIAQLIDNLLTPYRAGGIDEPKWRRWTGIKPSSHSPRLDSAAEISAALAPLAGQKQDLITTLESLGFSDEQKDAPPP